MHINNREDRFKKDNSYEKKIVTPTGLEPAKSGLRVSVLTICASPVFRTRGAKVSIYLVDRLCNAHDRWH